MLVFALFSSLPTLSHFYGKKISLALGENETGSRASLANSFLITTLMVSVRLFPGYIKKPTTLNADLG